MKNLKAKIEKEVEKIWPEAKKNLAKANRDLKKLMKSSEKTFAQLLAQTKKKTEEVISRTRREQLYYELGKKIIGLLTSDQLKDKNVLKVYTEIQRLNKKLRAL